MNLYTYYNGCMCWTSFSHVQPGLDEYAVEVLERVTSRGLFLDYNLRTDIMYGGAGGWVVC